MTSRRVLDLVGTLVRLALAGIWLVSGGVKLADRIGTIVAVDAYEVLPAGVVPVVASVLPLLEIALGVLLLVGVGTRVAAVVSAALLLVFLAGLGQAWARGLSIDCGCFGGGGAVAPGETQYGVELVRDVGFLAMAVWLAVRPRTLLALDSLWAPPRPAEATERNDVERVGVAMGRTERERREASQARLAAAGIQPKRTRRSGGKQGLAIAAVVLVVAVVAGVVIAWQTSSSGTESTAAPAAATYQATRDGAVVVAGSATAPVTVDVYEDFLCPACQQFEKIYGDEITTALNEGKVKVNYHLLAILEERSTPPGYSSLAGGAGLCAAESGIWPAFHARLYTEQPSEGAAGKTAQELVTIGQQLGASGDFAGCVNNTANGQAILDATNAAASDQTVAPGGRLSTPTVLLNGAQVDINDADWLKRATGGA